MKTSPIAICATHLRDLRIQADLDYACNAGLAESMLLEYPACMDARYLYDAEKNRGSVSCFVEQAD